MALDSRDLFVVQRTFGTDANKTFKATAEQIADYIAATPAVHYMGAADFTNPSEVPSDPQDGDLWVNNQQTPGRFSWGTHLPLDPDDGTSDLPVDYFDKCIWNATELRWDVFATPGDGSGGTLTDITVQEPLAKDDGVSNPDAAQPDLSIRDAKKTSVTPPVGQTRKGVVESLAVQSDVVNDPNNDGAASPNPNAVVTADLLLAANRRIDGAVAGGVTDIIPVKPEDADTINLWDPWNNDANTQTAVLIYDNSTDPTIPLGDEHIAIKYATENQAGVSYLASADPGAVMDFTGAEQDLEAGQPGGSLDNRGMMTTRRTYVNFVPRDFEQLNDISTASTN